MFSDPQFWVAIAFAAFILAIFNPVRKILVSNLDNQIKQIKNNINEAENLKNEAKVTLGEVKQRQSDVQKEIEELKVEAKIKISQIEEMAEKKLLDQIQKRQNLAEEKINQLARDANSEIHNHITSTSIDAAIKVLEKKLNTEEKQKLINSSINELNNVLKN